MIERLTFECDCHKTFTAWWSIVSKIQLHSRRLVIAASATSFKEQESHPKLLTTRDRVIQRFEIAMNLSRKIESKPISLN